jgi:hypothetical protein
MNRWHCSKKGCEACAYGVGEAKGLTAIGWYFKPGFEWWGTVHVPAVLYCPEHHPHGYRTAQRQADVVQRGIP